MNAEPTGTPPRGKVRTLVVVSYQDTWPDRAREVIAWLEAVLRPLEARVEHIGSTSVAHMPAKDVIDLQIGVDDLERADQHLDRSLRGAGFDPFPELLDSVPVGRDDDPGAWRKRVWARRDHPDGDVNLHIRRRGSPGERLALLFRDWFRAHPEAVEPYGQFKTRLARLAPDVDTYSDVKHPVVTLVAAVAEDWASTTGWQPYDGLSG